MIDTVRAGKPLFVWSNNWNTRVQTMTEFVLEYKLLLFLNQQASEIKIINFKLSFKKTQKQTYSAKTFSLMR